MIRAARPALALTAAVAVGGCMHVTRKFDETRFTGNSREVVRDDARPRPATAEVTQNGTLRFVEPLVCTADVMLEQTPSHTYVTRPNMATFIVGLILTSVGGISLTVGLSADEPRKSPASALGVVTGAVGLVLAIKPWFGNGTLRVEQQPFEAAAKQKPVACGSRPVTSNEALVSIDGHRLVGALHDGELGQSPFQFVDAFALHKVTGVRVRADIGDTTVDTVLDGPALAVGRDGYFRTIGVDGTVDRLRKVPGVEVQRIDIARVLAAGQSAVEVRIAVHNRGPGEAFGVRAHIGSSHPALDGGIAYVGRLPAGASRTALWSVPWPADDSALADTRLAVTVIDAHDTTSRVPIRFTGPILNEQ